MNNAPRFFATPAEFGAWLRANHEKAEELLVGFWKTHTGRASITWPQSVDEALCVGWIDGVRKSLGEDSYTIRFTPRRPNSVWSAVNIRRAQELIAQGRMLPAGQRAFEARTENRSGLYSYENRPESLPASAERQFRTHQAAWTWWQGQAASYRRAAIWWVLSAKREETRAKRLAQLIEDSAAQQRIKPMR